MQASSLEHVASWTSSCTCHTPRLHQTLQEAGHNLLPFGRDQLQAAVYTADVVCNVQEALRQPTPPPAAADAEESESHAESEEDSEMSADDDDDDDDDESEGELVFVCGVVRASVKQASLRGGL